MKILSVDDSRAVHAYLDFVLLAHKFQIEHCYSGDDALKLFKDAAAPNEMFDLILMDWEMPGLTGVQTVKAIREAGVKIPIIMVTTKNLPDEIMEALQVGANEYVMKPFTPDILLQKISSAMGGLFNVA